jgi:hypothetical protein
MRIIKVKIRDLHKYPYDEMYGANIIFSMGKWQSGIYTIYLLVLFGYEISLILMKK